AVAQMSWEANAVQLTGLAAQAKRRGLYEKALAGCSPATREAFENPHAKRWHPGAVLIDFSDRLLAACDPKTFELMNYDMARESFGPILRPMVQVAMTLTGRTPATLFARMNASIGSAVKNVTSSWVPQGPNAGELGFHYPEPVSPDAAHAWRGAIRFVAELSGHTVRETKFAHDGGSFRFTLSW
ncbi:MAG TPA: hypothetical protein VGE37_05600, partial [Archangium sp.]